MGLLCDNLKFRKFIQDVIPFFGIKKFKLILSESVLGFTRGELCCLNATILHYEKKKKEFSVRDRNEAFW